MKEEEYARRHPVKTLEGTGGHEERSVGGSVEVGGGRGGGSTSKCAHALSCVCSCTRGAVELCVRVTYVCALFFFRVPLLLLSTPLGTTLRARASANIWSQGVREGARRVVWKDIEK